MVVLYGTWSIMPPCTDSTNFCCEGRRLDLGIHHIRANSLALCMDIACRPRPSCVSPRFRPNIAVVKAFQPKSLVSSAPKRQSRTYQRGDYQSVIGPQFRSFHSPRDYSQNDSQPGYTKARHRSSDHLRSLTRRFEVGHFLCSTIFCLRRCIFEQACVNRPAEAITVWMWIYDGGGWVNAQLRH